MLKIEGENRIDIEVLVDYLSDKYEVSDKLALKWFVKAIQYNVVIEAITDQIEYLLDEGIIGR